MKQAKYIILDGYLPVIFSDAMTHWDVAVALKDTCGFDCKPTGAGFVQQNEKGELTCYGESVSLKIKSNGEKDSKILNEKLGFITF